MADIPGASAQHSIITPECRIGRGDDGAFNEAVTRAREAYRQIVDGWAGREQQPTLHLALTLVRPVDDSDIMEGSEFDGPNPT